MKYLIDFKHDASDQDIQSYVAENNGVLLKEWDNFDKVFLVETESILPTSSLVELIVEEVELKIKPLNYKFHVEGDLNSNWMSHEDPSLPKITIDTSSDRDWWKNYTYQNPVLDLPSYELSRVGDKITIYLMDSGIESSHPEFEGANISNLYTVTPGDFEDHRGHGTALASVIVGKTCGITNAKIKNVKIFENNHNTLQSELLTALDAIISDHIDGTLSVLNCSWIIEKNEWVENKLRILTDQGIHILASAGNYGTTIENVTPASMLEALTVGAYNKDLVPCDFSDYTGALSTTLNQVNHGELDGWAPGELIWVAGLNGTYSFVAGTSIATAISSAVLASNMSWFVHEDGSIIPPYDLQSFSSLGSIGSTLVFRRKDLLDYPDPKYNDSKNLIATWRDRVQSIHQFPDDITMKVRINEANKPIIIGTVFFPGLTKRVEWVDALPEPFFCTIEGKILVNPSLLISPASDYNILTASFNRTNLDDTVELVKITIYMLSQTFDPDATPPDDPILTILLQKNTTCFAPGDFCMFTPDDAPCFDSCQGGEICCDSLCGKTDIVCECNFSC